MNDTALSLSEQAFAELVKMSNDAGPVPQCVGGGLTLGAEYVREFAGDFLERAIVGGYRATVGVNNGRVELELHMH